MINTSGKIETLRTAVAESRVLAKKETIQRAVKGETPKGDVLNIARVAAILAAKKEDLRADPLLPSAGLGLCQHLL